MEADTPTTEDPALARRRLFWRNYLAHVAEGGLFMGGLSFVSSDTVFPRMIDALGGPTWLVALAPNLMAIGFYLPPIFNAHWIERLHRVRAVVLLFGALQRLPYLVAALALLFLGGSHPALALALAASAPLVSGLVGGIGLSAWFELVGRVIPAERLASSWALRQILMALIGIGAGAGIKAALDAHPGAWGYGILHLVAFLFLLASLASIAVIREIVPPAHARGEPRGLLDNLASLPAILRSDRSYRNFLLSRAFAAGIFLVTPFLSIHALRVAGRGDAFLGDLVLAQMLGTLAGNLVAGLLGDRSGNRSPMLLARALFVVAILGFAFNRSAHGFLVLFFLYGAAYYMNQVSENAFSLEIAPANRRPTYLAILFLVTCASMLGAAGLATALATSSRHGILPAAIAAAILLAASYRALLGVPEPRAPIARSNRPDR